MSTPDVTTLLAEALHREASEMTVTDSHQAVQRLERTVRVHRQRRVVLALAAAAVAIGVLVAGAALVGGEDRASAPPAEKQSESLPPPGHRIVFTSAEDKLLVVSDRGGRAVPVLDGDQPRFSPDGRRLVFTGKNGVPSVVVVGDWQGHQPLDDRPLPAGYERVGLVWSPDGTRVAYVEMLDSDFPEGGDLFVVDVASGTAEKIRHFAGPYVKPLEWSPDGSSLLMGFDRSGEGGRMVVDSLDLSSGELTPLLRGWGETLGVRYSPDGTQIAFYSDSRACICVAAPDGSDVRVVLQFSGAEPDSARLAWSPDGTKIAWSERFGGRIRLLDVQSGVSRKIATGGGQASGIDWDRR